MQYLTPSDAFRVAQHHLGSDKDSPGDLYIAEVTGPYTYFHNVPHDPYEHAHRFPAKWDRDKNHEPITYQHHAWVLESTVVSGSRHFFL
jgi:hypothetical protein